VEITPIRHADVLDCIAVLRRHVATTCGSDASAEAFVTATLHAFTEGDFVVTDIGSMRKQMLALLLAIWMTTSGCLRGDMLEPAADRDGIDPDAESMRTEETISAGNSSAGLNDAITQETRILPCSIMRPVTHVALMALTDLGLEPF
jgi:hypothetical protein